MSTPTNQLTAASPQTWTTHDRGDTASAWTKQNDSITQTVAVGTTANGTGTLLVLPTTAIPDMEILLLEYSPGSTYISGLVFNHIDHQNFCLLVVNQYSASYSGYKVLLQQVTAGKASTIHEEKFEETLPAEVRLAVALEDGALTLHLNTTEVYNWSSTAFTPAGGIGLYTQSNNDTVFKGVYMGAADDLEEQVEEDHEEPVEEGEVVGDTAAMDEAKTTEEIEIESPFDSFLKLQTPKALSQVEFREVFHVPLDAFYVSLYEGQVPIPAPTKVVEDENPVANRFSWAHVGEVFHMHRLDQIRAIDFNGGNLNLFTTGGMPQNDLLPQHIAIDLSTGNYHSTPVPVTNNKVRFMGSSAKPDEPIRLDRYFTEQLYSTATAVTHHTAVLPPFLVHGMCGTMAENEELAANYDFSGGTVHIRQLDTDTETTVRIGQHSIKFLQFVCNNLYLLAVCTSVSRQLLSIEVKTGIVTILPLSHAILTRPDSLSDQHIRVLQWDRTAIFDLSLGLRTHLLEGDYRKSHVSPHGTYFAEVLDVLVIVHNLNDATEQYQTSCELPQSCVFSREDELIIVQQGQRKDLRWSFKTGAPTTFDAVAPSSTFVGISYAHDGGKVALSYLNDLYWYTLPDYTLLDKVSSLGNRHFYFSADDTTLVTQAASGNIAYNIIDKIRLSLTGANGATQLYFDKISKDGTAATTRGNTNQNGVNIDVRELATGKLIGSVTAASYPTGSDCNLSSTGTYLQLRTKVYQQALVRGANAQYPVVKLAGSGFYAFCTRDNVSVLIPSSRIYHTETGRYQSHFGPSVMTRSGFVYTSHDDGRTSVAGHHNPVLRTYYDVHQSRAAHFKLSPDETVLYSFCNSDKMLASTVLADKSISKTKLDFTPWHIQPNHDGTKVLLLGSVNGRPWLHVLDESGNELNAVEVDLAAAWFACQDTVVLGYTRNGTAPTLQYIKIAQAPSSLQATAPITDTIPPTSFTHLLDYRPKRWYRQFKLADDEAEFQHALADNLSTLINELNTVQMEVETGENPLIDHATLSDQLYRMGSYRQKYQQAMQALFAARDVKQDVVHKARTSGYLLLDNQQDSTNKQTLAYTKDGKLVSYDVGLDATMTSLGYHFGIMKGLPEHRAYQPLVLHLNRYDFTDHDDWQVCLSDFQTRLFGSGAITAQQERLFGIQAAELVSYGSSDVLLKKERDLDQQIKDTDTRIAQVKASQVRIMQDKSSWKRDRAKLNKLLNAFSFGRAAITEVTDLYNKLRGTTFEKFDFRFENYIRKSSGVRKVTKRFWLWTRTYRYNFVINYHTYRIFHQYKEFSNHQFGIRYRHTPFNGFFRFLSFYRGYSNSALDYLHQLMRICDVYSNNTDQLLSQADADIRKINNEKLLHQQAKDQLKANGLMQLRLSFLHYWNDPEQFGARPIINNVIRPDTDPLADLISDFLLDDTGSEGVQVETDVFDFRGDRYYNQDGLTIDGYLRYLQNIEQERIALFPRFTDEGESDPDMLTAVVNPIEKQGFEFSLPVIKFVETHKILVTWNGYSLGELAHTENLFPNETKEITVERITQLVRKREESRSTSSTSTSKQTASFEEKLTSEFSQKHKQEKAREDSFETKDTTKTSRDTTQTDTRAEEFSIDASVSASYGFAKASLDMGYSKKSNSTKTDNKKDSFELSRTKKGKTSSKESREAFKKDTASAIKKVAQETTQENKVEVKVNTSEESSVTDARKEVVSLENPNAGRTVNYNFFQVQNNYEVKTMLTDVKIVVDHNVELIKGSGVSEVRVYELEEVGKILEADEIDDPERVLTAAIVARQAFKNYLKGAHGIGRGNGALAIEPPFDPDTQAMATLFFSNELDSEQLGDTLISNLSAALEYLKKVPFRFEEVEVNPAETYAVNTGGYFLDAEVGKMTALEGYLEQSRTVELENRAQPDFEPAFSLDQE